MKTWKCCKVKEITLTPHKHDTKKCRLSAKTKAASVKWQVEATFSVGENYIEEKFQHNVCFVIGSNTKDSEMTDIELFRGYKSQSNLEGGFRFIKGSLLFVSSLFFKKPSRIEALLMIMTLSLFVYSRGTWRAMRIASGVAQVSSSAQGNLQQLAELTEKVQQLHPRRVSHPRGSAVSDGDVWDTKGCRRTRLTSL